MKHGPIPGLCHLPGCHGVTGVGAVQQRGPRCSAQVDGCGEGQQNDNGCSTAHSGIFNYPPNAHKSKEARFLFGNPRDTGYLMYLAGFRMTSNSSISCPGSGPALSSNRTHSLNFSSTSPWPDGAKRFGKKWLDGAKFREEIEKLIDSSAPSPYSNTIHDRSLPYYCPPAGCVANALVWS